ncbi:MAG: transcription elongation factor GreA [Spirochaetales bacterium]|uniref:Transcription elongation factor GreA n=1 Tax=Candidatus Thalassospirochaeta sargassi TaxID=3119039 RepID=A0AAJ1IAZ7_9SPIO|nr:transcription elongation factor GreA [Spirochaetales bacterium]
MSADCVKTITEILNEEKWTRATLNNYSINNFKELDALIKLAYEEELQTEVKELCDEHLTHTKNSIAALYISGILGLRRQLIDDTNLVILITIFADNHKWNIVEFLCSSILEFGENKYALRTLADCYENENEEDKKFEVWERLIKVDYEEAEIVKVLAEKREEDGDIEGAVELYKKAIHRFVNKKLFSSVKEIWSKLIQYSPEEVDFFEHVNRKVSTIISDERASQLLEDLYGYYKSQEDWSRCIDILKEILMYDSKNAWARKEITDSYKAKYSYHSQLDEYIRLSNLNQSWRNVHDAIADFEKHISFDVGSFVSHKAWGIGKIRKINGDEITIDFVKKRDHKMSLKMAVNALTSLASDHISALKVRKKKEVLKNKIKSDVPWALKIVIKSFDNAANMKQIKAAIVPSILTPGEWSSWSTQARNILKEDPVFGNHPDKIDVFMVRDKPISKEEKIYNKFKAEKNFFNKIKALDDFVKISDPESDLFNEMFTYFANLLKSYTNADEQVAASFFVVKKLIDQYPFLNSAEFNLDFLNLIENIEDLESVYVGIDNADIRKQFLIALKQKEEWPDIYVRLFPKAMSTSIIDELSNSGHREKIEALFLSIADRYREFRETFIWIVKNYVSEKWCEKHNVSYEKILINMIHLLDITYREISDKRDVSDNRRLNKQILTFLIKDENLVNYINEADQDSVNRIYTLISDVKDLDVKLKQELKQLIKERFKGFKFYDEESPKADVKAAVRGLLVSEKAFKEKQKELKHIIEVEIPTNSKEIGAAIELGDLSENAEYKAGKEKQELLQIAVGKLQEDIDKAKVIDPKSITNDKIAFGIVVTLKNNISGENEVFTIMGPWESDPAKNIISYQSPFAGELLGHGKGEQLKFTINEREYDYSVEELVTADF